MRWQYARESRASRAGIVRPRGVEKSINKRSSAGGEVRSERDGVGALGRGWTAGEGGEVTNNVCKAGNMVRAIDKEWEIS